MNGVLQEFWGLPEAEVLGLLFSQFKSPLVLILTFAAGLAFLTGDRPDAFIILFIFKAGDTIPADGLLLDAKDLFADEAVLTGETYVDGSFAQPPNRPSEGSGKRQHRVGTIPVVVLRIWEYGNIIG